MKRLNGPLHQLKYEPDILTEYNTDQDTAATGNRGAHRESIISQYPWSTLPSTSGLPHHSVVRQDKATTKLRLVYDVSARSNGPSLNDCLNPGPKFDHKILSHFWVHWVAITANIKAFLRVSVAAKDRGFLRFLWVDNPNKDDPRIIVYRFTRVEFGVTASPFLLNATLRHLELHSETHGEVVSRVLRSIYVDDIITSSHEAY